MEYLSPPSLSPLSTLIASVKAFEGAHMRRRRAGDPACEFGATVQTAAGGAVGWCTCFFPSESFPPHDARRLVFHYVSPDGEHSESSHVSKTVRRFPLFTLCPCLAEHSSCLNGVYPRNDDGVAPAAPRVRCCRPAACFPFHGSPPALGVPRAPGMRKPPHARAHAVFRPPARHSVCPLKPRARLLLSSGNSSSGLSLALSPSASSLCSASALRDMPGRLVSRPLPPTAPSLCPAPRFWKPGEVLRSVLQLGDAAASSIRPAGSEIPADASVLGDVFHLSWSSQHLSRLSEDATCARQSGDLFCRLREQVLFAALGRFSVVRLPFFKCVSGRGRCLRRTFSVSCLPWPLCPPRLSVREASRCPVPPGHAVLPPP